MLSKKFEAEWRGFSEYIGSLIVEDFMSPRTYSQLLFDDASFSRPKLYFWILGCLNEFDVVIEDNIKQWTLYRQARVDKLLNRFAEPTPASSSEKSPETSPEKAHGSLPTRRDPDKGLKKFRELARKAEYIRQSLEDLRAQFKAKQSKVQALRDGLFNASALMESRSSTRLGMNVQLLTSVSIFYLPLAFCAALWAIPNITTATSGVLSLSLRCSWASVRTRLSSISKISLGFLEKCFSVADPDCCKTRKSILNSCGGRSDGNSKNFLQTRV